MAVFHVFFSNHIVHVITHFLVTEEVAVVINKCHLVRVVLFITIITIVVVVVIVVGVVVVVVVGGVGGVIVVSVIVFVVIIVFVRGVGVVRVVVVVVVREMCLLVFLVTSVERPCTWVRVVLRQCICSYVLAIIALSLSM